MLLHSSHLYNLFSVEQTLHFYKFYSSCEYLKLKVLLNVVLHNKFSEKLSLKCNYKYNVDTLEVLWQMFILKTYLSLKKELLKLQVFIHSFQQDNLTLF